MDSFRDIINAWPSIAAFAEDADITDVHARTMRTRNSIPSVYWEPLVAGATKRSIPDTTLSLFHATERARKARGTVAGGSVVVAATISAKPPQIKATQP